MLHHLVPQTRLRHLVSQAVALFALFALRSNADVITRFAQSAEIGVEQLPENKDTDKITFFAAVRNEKSISALNSNYILSFGQPSCEDSCAQSRSSVCAKTSTITEGWEDFELDHYPTKKDPAAIYIRKTFSMSDEIACNKIGFIFFFIILYTVN